MPASRNDIDVEKAVLKTLSYFDIFSYPLTEQEINQFLSVSTTRFQLQLALQQLAIGGTIHQSGVLYSFTNEESVFDRRRKGNQMATQLAPAVRAKAITISKFPFVRAVLASGSFSKNYMDEHSDFDYFIICASRRIWISRMLLVIYKRLFLNNSHKHFCVNYFIDEANLLIPEQNIFSATELATVVPLTGISYWHKLMDSNSSWLTKYFPNWRRSTDAASPSDRSSKLKLMLERIIDICGGNFFNTFFRYLTVKRWRKQYQRHYSEKDFVHAFKSTEGVSKNHPRNFQKKILRDYETRVAALTKKIKAA